MIPDQFCSDLGVGNDENLVPALQDNVNWLRQEGNETAPWQKNE
jgi:hypothetical protein